MSEINQTAPPGNVIHVAGSGDEFTFYVTNHVDCAVTLYVQRGDDERPIERVIAARDVDTPVTVRVRPGETVKAYCDQAAALSIRG